MDPNDIFHIYTLTEVSVVSFNYTIIQYIRGGFYNKRTI